MASNPAQDEPSQRAKAHFNSYDFTEKVELEMPNDFWQLPEVTRNMLLDLEYDVWCDGGRKPWELLSPSADNGMDCGEDAFCPL